MSKYLILIKTQFKDNFVYRMSTLAGIIVGIIQVYVLYYIWFNVYDNADKMVGYSLKQISTYVIFSTVIYRLIELGITLKIADLVRSGEIALKLIKPINFISSLFFESIGSLIASVLTIVIPIFVFCIFAIGIYIQTDLLTILLFVVSVLLAIIISIYVDIFFGLLSFWTENGWGLRVIRQALIKLFSGAIVPLTFMPLWFKNVCDFLPFKTLIDVPINIYIFGASKSSYLSVGIQLIWVIALMIITNALYKVIIKKLNINGG